jgi:hypothetical protein
VGRIPCDLSPKAYSLNQLRYDLRKLKGHGRERKLEAAYHKADKAIQQIVDRMGSDPGSLISVSIEHRIVALTVHAVSSGRYSFDPLAP